MKIRRKAVYILNARPKCVAWESREANYLPRVPLGLGRDANQGRRGQRTRRNEEGLSEGRSGWAKAPVAEQKPLGRVFGHGEARAALERVYFRGKGFSGEQREQICDLNPGHPRCRVGRGHASIE